METLPVYKEYGKVSGSTYGKIDDLSITYVGNLILLMCPDVIFPNYQVSIFLYSRDSLINRQTNEKYYNQKFVKK